MSVIVEIFLLFEKIIDLFNFQFFFNQSAPFQRLKETFCFPFTCLTTGTDQRTNSKLFYFKGKRGCVKYGEYSVRQCSSYFIFSSLPGQNLNLDLKQRGL